MTSFETDDNGEVVEIFDDAEPIDPGIPAHISIEPASTPLPPAEQHDDVCDVCLRPVSLRHLKRLPGRREHACEVCVDQQAQQAEDDRAQLGDEAGPKRTKVRLDLWSALPPELRRQLLAGRYGIDPTSTSWAWVPKPRGGRTSMTYTDGDGMPSSGVTVRGGQLDWDIPWSYWRDWKRKPWKHTRPHA